MRTLAMKPRFSASRFLAITALAAGMQMGIVALSHAADPSEFTEAERQMFVTDHLGSLATPATLHYRTERRGSLQEPIDDKAVLHLKRENDMLVASVDWMSGSNRLELPPFDDIKGNPVLLHFLEREIREMNRLTGGSMNYYRKRIRMALAQSPGVEDTTADFQGRKVAATRITISPYLDDPARARYEKYAARNYTIVLSDEVPGVVLAVTAELRDGGGARDAGNLLWSESLRFDRSE